METTVQMDIAILLLVPLIRANEIFPKLMKINIVTNGSFGLLDIPFES